MPQNYSNRRFLSPSFSYLLLSSLLLLSGCGKKHSIDHSKDETPTSVIPEDAARTEPTPIAVLPPPSDLSKISEESPVNGNQVWLKKSFWLGRDIDLSIGVERASITGLAMSVIGYVPARVERSGGRLVLLRRNLGQFGGTVLGPELGINAYPIVSETTDEVLVDMSSPQMPYGLGSVELFRDEGSYPKMSLRYEYLKGIELGDSRLSFNSVVGLTSSLPLFSKDSSAEESAEVQLNQDPYTLDMSLRTDWLVRPENSTFKTQVWNNDLFAFFTENPFIIAGDLLQRVTNKIDASKAMTYEMSASTPELYRGAIKEGVEAWNGALGGRVLSVRVGQEQDSLTDPSRSHIVWDDNTLVGSAFANYRSNPYTGEILQSQIYLSGSLWVQNAQLTHKLRSLEKSIRKTKSESLTVQPIAPAIYKQSLNEQGADMNANEIQGEMNSLRREILESVKKEMGKEQLRQAAGRRFFVGLSPAMVQEKIRSRNFCLRRAPKASELLKKLDLLEALSAAQTRANPKPIFGLLAPDDSSNAHNPYPSDLDNAESFTLKVLRSVIMHEVGHTLGLKHNFMGSTGITPAESIAAEILSASVMDYNDIVVEAQFNRPGAYDTDMIKMLYRGKSPQRFHRFCSDEQEAQKLPDCERFDYGNNPLLAHRTLEESNLLLAAKFHSLNQPATAVKYLVKALNSFGPSLAFLAYSELDGKSALLDASFGTRQEQAWKDYEDSKQLLKVEFDDNFAIPYRQTLIQKLAKAVTPNTADSAVYTNILDELKNVLVNASNKADATTRIAALEGLKRVQSARARLALEESLTELQAKMLAAGPEDIGALQRDKDMLNQIQLLLRTGYYLPGSSEVKNAIE